MTIQIRKAKQSDAPAILALRNAAIRAQCGAVYLPEVLRIWTADDMPAGFAADVERCFYVAFRNATLVGSGAIDLASGKIDAVFVHPDHFRSGVGRTMLAYLEGLATAAGLQELHLESTLNAAAFYRAQGFQGDKVGTYTSPRGIVLSCVPMTKRLRDQESPVVKGTE